MTSKKTYRLESNPEFLRRIARGRAEIQQGLGVRLEDVPPPRDGDKALKRATLIWSAVGALCGAVAMPLFKHSDEPFIYLLLGAWYLADMVGLSTRDWAIGVAAVLYFGILGGVAGHLLMAARSKVGVVAEPWGPLLACRGNARHLQAVAQPAAVGQR